MENIILYQLDLKSNTSTKFYQICHTFCELHTKIAELEKRRQVDSDSLSDFDNKDYQCQTPI